MNWRDVTEICSISNGSITVITFESTGEKLFPPGDRQAGAFWNVTVLELEFHYLKIG
jgi:hypothetical protein